MFGCGITGAGGSPIGCTGLLVPIGVGATRRGSMSDKPSCKRDPLYKIIASLHMPGDPPWRLEHEDVPVGGEADNPVALWRGLMMDMLQALGLTHPAVVLGVLMELCNNFPMEQRMMLAQGIIEGKGLEVSYNKETKEAGVGLPQKYDAVGDKGEVKRPSGLILPGQEGTK